MACGAMLTHFLRLRLGSCIRNIDVDSVSGKSIAMASDIAYKLTRSIALMDIPNGKNDAKKETPPGVGG